jgi:hypothetical protein
MSDAGKVTRRAAEFWTRGASKALNETTDLTGPYKNQKTPNIIQIKITGRDNGFSGPLIYYTGVEVLKDKSGFPQAIKNGREFGSSTEKGILLRGRRNQRVVTGSIVTAHLVGSKDGLVWEIDFEVESYKSFIFEGANNGNHDYDSSFTMIQGGEIITNFGDAIINVNPIFTITIGERAWVEITFVKDASGNITGGAAEIVKSIKQFPVTRRENDDELIISIPVAEVVPFQATGYLVQYQCNDILVEATTIGASYEYDPNDPNPPVPVPKDPKPAISLDDKWLKWRAPQQIYHAVLGAAEAAGAVPDDCNWKYMKLLSNDFDCSTVSFSDASVTALRDDVQNWVNNTLLAEVKRILADQTGHIYQYANCDGTSAEYLDGNKECLTGYTFYPASINLTLTFTTSAVELDPGDSIAVKSVVKDGTSDYTGWNSGGGDERDVTYSMSAGGRTVQIYEVSASDKAAYKKDAIVALGGSESGDTGTYYPCIECFYNETVTVTASVAGTGVQDTNTFTTRIVNMAISSNMVVKANIGTDTTADLSVTFDLTNSVAAAFTDFNSDGIHEFDYDVKWSDGTGVETTAGPLFVGSTQAGDSITVTERIITTGKSALTLDIYCTVVNTTENCEVNIKNSVITSTANFGWSDEFDGS